MNAVLYGHSFRFPSQLTPSAHPLSEYIMNDVSSPDRNVRLLPRSLARLHLAQSDDDAGRKRRSIERMSKCACVVRLRSAACTPSLPSSPLLASNITTVFGFLVRYGRSKPQGEGGSKQGLISALREKPPPILTDIFFA